MASAAAVVGGGAAAKDFDRSEKSEYANRVSRLRGVMGAEALAKLSTSSVLIIGLGGLGVEIAKNVILTGVQSCTLYDKAPASHADLASQFFISEQDIGKPRAAVSLPQLRTLNPYTAVDVHEGAVDDAFIAQFTVVVATECSYERQLQLNDACRKAGVKFIATDTAGVFGRAFCDFGPSFVVADQDGEPAQECVLANVAVDAETGVATITVDEEKRLEVGKGDFVTFKEVRGGAAAALNGCEPKPIVERVDAFNFKVEGCDAATAASAYEGGGLMQQVKQPRTMAFRTLRECLQSPGELVVSDFSKFEAPATIHLGFAALDAFQKTHGDFPEPFNAAHQEEFLSTAQRLKSEQQGDGGAGDAQLDDAASKLLVELCRTCRGRLGPVCAVFGGIVGQEVLKACSAKFTPLHQLLYMDFCEALPSREEGEPFAVTKAEDVAPRGDRYDGQTAVFGHALQDVLMRQNLFLVGAGAIGCEMIKNWALMGVGTGRGMIHITDMDRIERSNLSRQFLFRERHIGELKSTTAAQAAQAMNPSLNIRAYDLAVGKATEVDFNEEFMQSLDAVVTALDNVDARLYCDDRAMQFCKPMLDSGTLGAKGNTQVVVPRKTVHWGAYRDPPAKSIALCTLKSFPYRIEHTIQWAKDWFDGQFTKIPANCDQYLRTGGEFVDSLNPNQKLQILEQVLNYFTPVGSGADKMQGGYARTFEDCMRWARLRFEQVFRNDVQQLVYNLPADKLLENGQKFWSGTKRCPTPLQFDVNDPAHMAFVVCAANLHAVSNGVPAAERHSDEAKFKQFLASVEIPPFTPSDGVKIATTDADAKKEEEEGNGEAVASVADTTAKLKTQINEAVTTLGHEAAGVAFSPAEFEKDDDSNFHVDFMTACSNLRARCYSIEEADRHKTKMTAGNIIPAIATTTALVTGLVCIELMKVLQNKPLEAFKDANVNLALPFFAMFEPSPTSAIQLNGHRFTPWDTIDIPGPKTLNEFIAFLEDTYDVSVSMLSYGNAIIYSFFAAAKKRRERGPMLVEDVVAQVTKKPLDPTQRYVIFDPYCTDADDEDVELPPVRYVRPR